MLGLFSTLNLGARSLQTQETGVEVSGQNLANINNAAYARQRVVIQTSADVQTAAGLQGTGAEVASIQSLRDSLIDSQVTSEQSVGGYWTSQQSALENAQSSLGQYIDSTSSTSSSTSGLADDLSGLFSAFQGVSASPTDISARQQLISAAQTLAQGFNSAASNLSGLNTTLNESVTNDTASANQLLGEIAGLNKQIALVQTPGSGAANDLIDKRQSDLESLAKLVNFSTSTDSGGQLDVSVGGVQMVAGQTVSDTLQTYDSGGGQLLLRAATAGTPLTLTGGSIQGTIDARDGALKTLRTGLDTLASNLVSQVNGIYSTGYSLTGSTGANFFTGTDASTIAVDATLSASPSLVQAAGTAGATGDNTVALALANLGSQTQTALNNETFSDNYAGVVGSLGNSLVEANTQLSDNSAVDSMLKTQRSSVSGVSMDEEMSNLVTYQKAYQASAEIIETVNQMLDIVMSMKTS